MLPNSERLSFDPALAKEVGLEASIILLVLEREIAERGMDRGNGRMAARDGKQLAALFPWLSNAGIGEELKSLQEKNFLYIEDATLLARDSTRWYGLNWRKLKALESIIVLGDGDIEDAHQSAILPEEPAKQNGNSLSQLHRDLMPVVIKMGNLTTPLLPRDAGEAQRFIRNIVKKYPDEGFERLQRRILGIRVWHESRVKGDKLSAPRPDSAWSSFEKYGTFCREHYNGNLPPIPEGWIRETARK